MDRDAGGEPEGKSFEFSRLFPWNGLIYLSAGSGAGLNHEGMLSMPNEKWNRPFGPILSVFLSGSLINKLGPKMSGSPEGCLGFAVDIKLFEYSLKVVLDRVLADTELFGDVIVGASLHDHGEDIDFAAGKDIPIGFFRAHVILLNQVGHDPSWHPEFSVQDGPNSFGEGLNGFSSVEKTPDPLGHEAFFHSRTLFQVKKAEGVHAWILFQQRGSSTPDCPPRQKDIKKGFQETLKPLSLLVGTAGFELAAP